MTEPSESTTEIAGETTEAPKDRPPVRREMSTDQRPPVRRFLNGGRGSSARVRLAVAALVLIGAVIGLWPSPAAAAGPCTIPGANQASWGCGIYDRINSKTIDVTFEDTKTDGSCVRIRILVRGTWKDANRRECSEVAQTVRITWPSNIDGVRITRKGNYRTIGQ